jgi:hypothetical protein
LDDWEIEELKNLQIGKGSAGLKKQKGERGKAKD